MNRIQANLLLPLFFVLITPLDFSVRALVLNGSSNGDKFGHTAITVGDLNQDGHDDILVTAPETTNSGLSKAGSAKIFSGLNGGLLWARFPSLANMKYGTSVAQVGDQNGDGVPDFAISAPGDLAGNGSVLIYSGRNGRLLRKILGTGGLFGSSIASAGDLTGDGREEIYVVAKVQGKIFAYNGSSVVRTITGNIFDDFGNSIAVGRFNGDLYPDLVVGEPGFMVGNSSDAGRVTVYSGANGSILKRYLAGDPGQTIGAYGLAGLKFGTIVIFADVNNDGYSDVGMSAPSGEPNLPGMGNSGVAYIYFGGLNPSNVPNRTYVGQAGGDALGTSMANAGDMNGDGHDDIVLGAPYHHPTPNTHRGMLRVYSGSNSAILITKFGQVVGDLLGSSVYSVGDLNGDNRPEVGGASLFNSIGLWSGQVETFAF